MKILQPLGVHFVDYNDRQSLVANIIPLDTDKSFYYQSHKKDLMELFDSLADETSKRALYFYVESFVKNCVYGGEHNPTRWKYFFGGKYERFYKHLDGECWINCGANIGDTVFAYLSFDFKPKKIYAFEGDKKSYDAMLKNFSLLLPDKRALVEPINAMIDEQTDFEKILAGNKCTLLNADIEGAELKLLHAMEKIIRNDRPVVAICVYHFKEDILSVSKFLQSICPDYIFYFRKYTPHWGSLKKNGEPVFYAVPVERSCRS
ncbi:MAG: FkbM family methyltransferase [Selenomonadaceae bacterium]|nr:FkbM family methyltransferase [Selenomonadaceae bacterium]MBQ3727597.1 FkbM family methyltransferase [Selenomonadaceae bacterium]MBQ9497578.1 FkbM family methyltransferase [Selenomonadaceae bacterium]